MAARGTKAAGARNARRDFLTFLVSALVCVGAVSAATLAPTPDGARADDPVDLGQLPVDTNPDEVGNTPVSRRPDTDLTPIAKDGSEHWTQVAGARFGETTVDKGPTVFGDDLFTVAFRNEDEGLAGGSREVDCDGKPTHVPVIYRYHDPGEGPGWSLTYIGDCKDPGFVGAIAWMADGRALAVGGHAKYPRREPAFDPGGQAAGEPWGFRNDEAGDARAWLFDDSAEISDPWTDISTELPTAMHGMNALAFSADAAARGRELGFAGGLGQLWRWDGKPGDAHFTRVYDWRSPSFEFQSASAFRFRVRQIRFVDGGGVPQAFAITDGCCADLDPTGAGTELGANLGALGTVPLLLTYTEQPSWEQNTDNATGRPASPRWFAQSLDPLTRAPSFATKTLAPPPAGTRPDRPDSFYSFTAGKAGGGYTLAAVASPGGPVAAVERPSILTQPYCPRPDGSNTLASDQAFLDNIATVARFNVSSARLVSGDGDVGLSFQTHVGAEELGDPTKNADPAANALTGGLADLFTGNAECHPDQSRTFDGVPDWVVGELRSKSVAAGHQALALATALRPRAVPDTVNYRPDIGNPVDSTTSPDKIEAYLRSEFFLLPSYSLNAVTVLDPTAKGWAVGDHGAIVALGEATGKRTAGGDAPPPQLSDRHARALPERGPFAELTGLTAPEPGTVPPLASQPKQDTKVPALVSVGSPDPTRPEAFLREDVGQILMSPDGGEGWALGPSAADGKTNEATLYHYDGVVWSRCDAKGLPGLVAPDPACAPIAPLLDNYDTGPEPVGIVAAARVPTENEADPTRASELEVVAVTTAFSLDGETKRPHMLRYRDARWSVDATPAPPGQVDGLAFVSATDGWAWETNGESTPTQLYHFDGEGWATCGVAQAVTAPAGCGGGDASDGVLAFAPGNGDRDRIAGVVTDGRRAHLYGWRTVNGIAYPLIRWLDPGQAWAAEPAGGGLDVGLEIRMGRRSASDATPGVVRSLALAHARDGSLSAWAYGAVGGGPVKVNAGASGVAESVRVANRMPDTTLMQFTSGEWRPFDDTGPVHDYMSVATTDGSVASDREAASDQQGTTARLHLLVPNADGSVDAYMAQRSTGRLFTFDRTDGRWRLLRQERTTAPGMSGGLPDESIQALAPDGSGGFWAALRSPIGGTFTVTRHTDFVHYTTHPRKPVFSEAPSPLRDPSGSLTSLAAAQDGSVWAGTRTGVLYRYDRLTGWDTISIPGWDPGRVVTRPSEVNAVAVGPNGDGIAVGRGGRIADLDRARVRVDEAAGVTCSKDPPPCGTGQNLRAAAVEPGGGAIAGGDRMALLWRPAGDTFRSIDGPDGSSSGTISGIAFPRPDRAWVTTTSGLLYRGDLEAGVWRWELENRAAGRRATLLSLDQVRRPLALRGIAVDASGRGYAVGDRGLLLERTGDAPRPWRRVKTPFLDDLTAVSLPLSGRGALVGGHNGLVLTLVDGRFQVARPADLSSRTETTGPVVGLVVSPGASPDTVEAWAATGARTDGLDRNIGLSQLFHYGSDDDSSLLRPTGRVLALPDAPEPRLGEIAFAAFGKTDCAAEASSEGCFEMDGSNQDYQTTVQRSIDEIVARSKRPGAPTFALFTGDATDTAGMPGNSPVDHGVGTVPNAAGGGAGGTGKAWAGARKQRRWREFIADRLRHAGIPLFGAVGSGDLSAATACYGGRLCPVHTQDTKVGDNLGWREAFAGQLAPWGSAVAPAGDDIKFVQVPDDGGAPVVPPDVAVWDPTGTHAVKGQTVTLGGARTHYAVDVIKGGRPAARIVTLDTSLKSLAAADPLQNPIEGNGGQLAWLDRMLCYKPQKLPAGGTCTRSPGQGAIVLSNTPTYSYGPTPPGETETDGAALEQKLLEGRTSVAVSGRLGWNALYWATAPGLHSPCPGSPYPDPDPPEAETACTSVADEHGVPDSTSAMKDVAQALRGLGAPSPPDPTGILGDSPVAGILPTVVASGAGGKFGGSGTASEGFWHGYTIVRVDASGDPARTIVEQRPVFDWINITGPTHVLRPGQKMTLRGVGREPLGVSSTVAQPWPVVTRYDEIDSPAITHRYDLIEADPDKPWLPKVVEGNGNPHGYVPLDPTVAAVDSKTGQVTTGRSSHPRVFALGVLSVGDKAASYPLVFEPKKSYVAKTPKLIASPAVPAIRVLGLTSQGLTAPPQAPPPTTPPPPVGVGLQLPTPPTIPTFPSASAPLIAPPVPPTAPPPPSQQGAPPLNVPINLSGIMVPPTTGISAQPTPPVNPAPPGGARKEARQKQAATAKSEEGSAGEETQGSTGDLAQGPIGPQASPMTRRDRAKAAADGFTPLTGRAQPSAWVTSLEWGGGTLLMALVLALGFTTVRPTPRGRRRGAPQPAPAWARRPPR